MIKMILKINIEFDLMNETKYKKISVTYSKESYKYI
jgi:hypothetical protein